MCQWIDTHQTIVAGIAAGMFAFAGVVAGLIGNGCCSDGIERRGDGTTAG